MYENILKKLEEMKIKIEDITKIVSEICLMFGVIIYFETIFRPDQFIDKKTVESSDSRTNNKFPIHAHLRSFNINIQKTSNKNGDGLMVEINFED